MAALDGLRGVAILLVLFHHVRAQFASSLNTTLLPGGFLGVDLFFVLSGFLITGLLIREFGPHRSIRLGAFYRRRVLRLYPALAVVLVAQAIYASSLHTPASVERSTVQSLLLYYYNWREVLIGAPGVGHLWSLSVEEQFYLVWPLLLFGLLIATGGRRRILVPVILVAIGAIAVYRAMRWHDGMFWLWMYIRTDFRADSLLIGALVAVGFGGLEPRRDFFHRHRWLPAAAWIAAIVFLVCAFSVQVDESFLYLGGYTLVAIACAVLLVAVLPGTSWPGARALAFRPLCTLGVVSYGLYLWHLLVFNAVDHYGESIPPIPRVGLALAITAICTVGSWFYVEQPFLRWKDRLESRALVPGTPEPI